MVALSVAADYVSPDSLWFDAAVLTAIFLAVSLILRDDVGILRHIAQAAVADERSMRIFNLAMAVALVAPPWLIVHEMI